MSSAARIAEVLAGREVRARGGNYLVPCPAHEDNSPSLSLRDTDRGLQVYCFAGCLPGDVYAAILRKGCDLRPGQTAPQPTKGTGAYERRQHETAAWMWSRRRPITGSVAEKYLREARGITIPLPATLAFLPPYKPEHKPAMIAAFAMVDEPAPGELGKPDMTDAAIHLTLLKPDGSGKANVNPNKLMIGRLLARPIIVAPPNDLMGLAITEGVEDALTAHQATGLGAWAAGSAGFMPKLADAVPSYIETAVIFAHDDQAGESGAQRLASALGERGIEVIVEGLS